MAINETEEREKKMLETELNYKNQENHFKTLIDKLTKAISQTGITQIAIAGGVSANSYLRKQLEILAAKENFDLYIPKFEYCTDNAAMIAIAGYFKFMDEDFATQSESPYARLLF